jgi:hypothetical protein
MSHKSAEQLPVIPWRKVTRAMLERTATRRIEVAVGPHRFVVERTNPGTYVTERRDGLLFDGRYPRKLAIGTKELKKFVVHSAIHDRKSGQ